MIAADGLSTPYSFHVPYILYHIVFYSAYPLLQGLRKYALSNLFPPCHFPRFHRHPVYLSLASKKSLLQRLQLGRLSWLTRTNVARYRAPTSPRRSANPTSSTFS